MQSYIPIISGIFYRYFLVISTKTPFAAVIWENNAIKFRYFASKPKMTEIAPFFTAIFQANMRAEKPASPKKDSRLFS
ncbi:hypothetical protein [Paenibacillus sp. TH7-28]